MAMNGKRLHLHSLPLLLFALATTMVMVVVANAWHSAPVTQALLRPAVRFETTDHGYVKVRTNKQAVDERPGVHIEGLPKEGRTVMRASQAADSIGLHMALDGAVK
jgi:hypothetical protein